MAYQNVGTPRFYVSVLQWLKSIGQLNIHPHSSFEPSGKDANAIVDINPSAQLSMTYKYSSDFHYESNSQLFRFQ